VDIILALTVALIIYLSFRVLEGKLPQFNFTILELVHGGFDIKNIGVSIVIPFSISYVFGLIYETTIPAVYIIPGFLAALLMVWPYFKNPEVIPPEMQMGKERAYVVYLLFVVSLSLISYLGGYVGSQGLSSFLPSGQGIKDEFWSVLIGAIFTHFAHRFLNNKNPQKPTLKKTDVNLSPEDTKPLDT